LATDKLSNIVAGRPTHDTHPHTLLNSERQI
jgi:hypothetical protein